MRNLLKPFCFLLALACTTASLSTASLALETQQQDDYYGRLRGQNASLNVFNWGEYISDGSDDSMNVNKEFEALTGIKVNYSTFATNEELYSKLRNGGASYDVIIPSDYMISRMVGEGMLEELDMENIPNFSYISENFLHASYDPENRFSVPYTWGVTGIIYNTTMVEDEITSWDILWDERYFGEILMFSNPRDAFSIAQKRLGYSLNDASAEKLTAAQELLKEQKPLVQAYVMDEIFDKMLGGEAALAPYYAGDALTMMDENEDLAFAVPQEGTNIFVDAMCIPKGSKNKLAAEMYINFMADPEVAAATAEFIGYASPNDGALELLDEEITANPVAYPPEEVVEAAEFFNELPRESSLLMDHLWTQLLSTDETYSQMLVPVLLVVCILLSIGINVLRFLKRKRHKKY